MIDQTNEPAWWLSTYLTGCTSNTEIGLRLLEPAHLLGWDAGTDPDRSP